MKLLLGSILTILTNLSFGQNKVVGLYGKCDKEYSGYMCQQVQFKPDKTFIFYDLLHLRGWTLSEGTWKQNGDTVILKSSGLLYQLNYEGTSSSDSITVTVTDSDEPLPFANIKINSKHASLDVSGSFKIPRQALDSLFIYYVGTYGPIVFNKEKLKSVERVVIKMNNNHLGKYYFENEKWLFVDNKLYFRRKYDGKFEREVYFPKVKATEFKYSKDY